MLSITTRAHMDVFSFVRMPKLSGQWTNTYRKPYGNPLPLVTSAFETLQQASIFTKLDLQSAYNLVRIREGDKWKMAFITPFGHYEYLVMPFELMNGPTIFQQYINEVLWEALDRNVLVYLDDFLIYSQMVDKHVTYVRRVPQLLLENHLFIKLEKSTFHVQTISFLGFVISHNALCMDPAKARAVENWSNASRASRTFTTVTCYMVVVVPTVDQFP
ncbi:hypothetical protein P4O66_007978 [Electrophorus voltai]|uniref:ribonuclease H n=1 Tax=Electrophorus voltai TaxID=2609070 RepID=A0AAD9E0I0_9TELE|nr:hypothetical protein P4O66_007978 [Electrophorus voltai]